MGIDAYNYGNGSVTLIDEAGTNVSGAQFGIAAYSNSSGAGSSGSVTINVGANATITAGALYGIAAIQGNIVNFGNVSITTGGWRHHQLRRNGNQCQQYRHQRGLKPDLHHDAAGAPSIRASISSREAAHRPAYPPATAPMVRSVRLSTAT